MDVIVLLSGSPTYIIILGGLATGIIFQLLLLIGFYILSLSFFKVFIWFFAISLKFQVNDTIVIDIVTGKMSDYVRFDQGNLCMVTGGRNMGRVGIVGHREKHPGSFDIVHIKDAAGHSFATR